MAEDIANGELGSHNINLPSVRQAYSFDCGAASVQSIMAFYGNNIREEKLMTALGTDSSDGTLVVNIIKFFKDHGFDVTAKSLTLDELKGFLDKKIPVVVVIQAWEDDPQVGYKDDWADGHYVVCQGYTDDGKFIFEDPSSFGKVWLNKDEFLLRWHDIDGTTKYQNFGIAVHGTPNPPHLEHMD